MPKLSLQVAATDSCQVQIRWRKQALISFEQDVTVKNNGQLKVSFAPATLLEVFDPQQMLSQVSKGSHELSATVHKENAYGTFFVKVKQGMASWWSPVNVAIEQPAAPVERPFYVKLASVVELGAYLNNKVTDIFNRKYLAPRSAYPTLQLPVQGIGNWCYPKVQPDIDDRGLRSKIDASNRIMLSHNLVMETPSDPAAANVVFTSRWDLDHDSVQIPLSGQGRYLAAMLCGTTNPMQSQLEQGRLIVRYTDGSETTLVLRNPDNWWPIEQDYHHDGFAFVLKASAPRRLHLRTGLEYDGCAPDSMYSSLKGFSNRMIAGGAANILQFAIDPQKTLRSLTLKTTASEVVIGLMALTVIQEISYEPEKKQEQ
ncbi:MAG: hypothetical protein EOP50_07325 [Sphingobacteriales bacterium]|nr:MAG: hypothetical protein EOP50_07325 [Sphingobacteriales bacterium]